MEPIEMMGYAAGIGFGWGGLFVFLGCILLVVGLAVLIAWAIGRIGQPSQMQTPRVTSQDPLDVLRLRFARGEMTAEEFNAARQTLEAQR